MSPCYGAGGTTRKEGRRESQELLKGPRHRMPLHCLIEFAVGKCARSAMPALGDGWLRERGDLHFSHCGEEVAKEAGAVIETLHDIPEAKVAGSDAGLVELGGA